MRVRRIVLPSVAYWLYHIFPYYLINGATVGLKLMNIKTRVLISSTIISKTFLILSINERDFNETFFSKDFRKISKYQVLSKYDQWEPSCSIWTDRHDEANSYFVAILRTGLKINNS